MIILDIPLKQQNSKNKIPQKSHINLVFREPELLAYVRCIAWHDRVPVTEYINRLIYEDLEKREKAGQYTPKMQETYEAVRRERQKAKELRMAKELPTMEKELKEASSSGEESHS